MHKKKLKFKHTANSHFINKHSSKKQITNVSDMKLTANVDPIIYNQRMCGKINSTQLNFTEIFSKIGEISHAFLDTLELILNPVIRVAADTTLQLGVPIPLVENVN